MTRGFPKKPTRVRLLLLGLVLFANASTYARVGGGQHYSGTPERHSGATNEGDVVSAIEIGSDISRPLIRAIVWFHVNHLLAALLLDAIIAYVIYFVFFAVKGSDDSRYGSGAEELLGSLEHHHLGIARRGLERIRTDFDPNFSTVLFKDFCYALCSTIHQARGEKKLDAYSAYLSEDATAALRQLNKGVLQKVSGIIIGAMRVESVHLPERDESDIVVDVQFETNCMETLTGGKTESWYSVEHWRLVRNRKVRSKPPERIRVIACPACGAPPSKNERGPCPSCGVVARGGEFDWFVENIRIQRTPRAPILSTQPEDTGTELPTLTDSGLSFSLRQYQAEHPEFDPAKFEARVRYLFVELQKAWSQRSWELARPFESDQLFQAHCYWITEYKRQKLFNVLDRVQVNQVVPVKLVQDAYYTSLTVRIFASMVDYTRDESGKVICGNPHVAKSFSEYWTFIRGTSAQVPKGSDRECPQCGAQLKINMAGHCEFCSSNITSGNFDWVLSQIEQDEAYSG